MTRETESAALELPVGADDHTQGPQTAPVTLVEYGDYESAGCGEAYPCVQKTRQRLGNRLRFVFRHFVNGSHPQGQHAAEAAEAAGAQGRFWEMHDILLTHQGTLDNGCLVEYADAIGLDIPRFLREMTGHVHANRVREDFEGGLRSGVKGTPTFFVNGVRYDAPWDAETLLAAVEAAAACREAQEVKCDVSLSETGDDHR